MKLTRKAEERVSHWAQMILDHFGYLVIGSVRTDYSVGSIVDGSQMEVPLNAALVIERESTLQEYQEQTTWVCGELGYPAAFAEHVSNRAAELFTEHKFFRVITE